MGLGINESWVLRDDGHLGRYIVLHYCNTSNVTLGQESKQEAVSKLYKSSLRCAASNS